MEETEFIYWSKLLLPSPGQGRERAVPHGAVSEGGGELDTLRGGGASIPSCTGTVAAPDSVLQFSGSRGGYSSVSREKEILPFEKRREDSSMKER